MPLVSFRVIDIGRRVSFILSASIPDGKVVGDVLEATLNLMYGASVKCNGVW